MVLKNSIIAIFFFKSGLGYTTHVVLSIERKKNPVTKNFFQWKGGSFKARCPIRNTFKRDKLQLIIEATEKDL